VLGLWLECMIFRVFCNLNDSMVLCFCEFGRIEPTSNKQSSSFSAYRFLETRKKCNSSTRNQSVFFLFPV